VRRTHVLGQTGIVQVKRRMRAAQTRDGPEDALLVYEALSYLCMGA
jgi:hypothetical protein